MKIHPLTSRFRFLFSLAGLLLLTPTAWGGATSFTLDFTNNNGRFDSGNVFITLDPGAVGTLGPSGPAIDYTGGGLSQSYSVADINAAGGFYFPGGSATASNFFVTYGNASLYNGTNTLSHAASDPTASDPNAPRYSQGELAGGNGDLTQINQYGGSLRVDNYAQNLTVNPTQSPTKSVYNNLDSGAAFQSIYSNVGGSAAVGTIVYTQSGISPGTTEFKRIVGPNQASNLGYPSYDGYLTHLNNISSVSNLSFTQNNIQGFGVSNAIDNGNGTYTVGNQTWQMNYNFQASVDSSNNIVFNGSVTATGGSTNVSGNTITYSGLYIVFPHDANQSGNIYFQTQSPTTIFSNTSSSTINNNGNITSGATWNNLNAYVNATPAQIGNTYPDSNLQIPNTGGNTVVNLKVTGDFEEGLATGFIGSSADSGNGTSFGNLTSYLWWTLQNKAYTNGAQPLGSMYLNIFGGTNFANSTLFNGTGNIVGGGVYTSPFDDRFGQNTIGADGEWMVTIMPDGAFMVVPEPATFALLLSGAALISTGIYRRVSRPRKAGAASSSLPDASSPPESSVDTDSRRLDG